MKTILGAVLILAALQQPEPLVKSDKYSIRPPKPAVTCFSAGEQTSGMNKICYYNCLGSTAAITISAVSLCPLSIQR